MKKLLAMWVVAGMAAVTAGQDRGANLTGAWRLAWLEQPGADGKPHRVDSTGLLVYTADGHMSVQVMESNPVSGAPETYSRGGYEASWGTYKLDQGAHTFTFHVEGALVRSLIGKDLPRAYELAGRQLIVKSMRQDERWRVAWLRY